MKERPLISIIVPVYNVEKYLRECLDSICGQQNIDSEIIVVDDGSTDGSGAICDEYAGKYANITVIHKQNEGAAFARNAGLDIITGDYVGFVDSDDYIAADMYETLLRAIVRTESDIACCGYKRVIGGEVTAEEKPVTKAVVLSGQEIIKNLMLDKEMTYSPWDKLFKAELFKEIRFPQKEKLPSEDMPCIYETLKKAEKVVYIGIAKYYYRLVLTSSTQKTFAPQNIGTVYYTQEICDDVIKSMPELRDEAFFTMIQCTSSVYAHMHTDGKQKECKKEKWYMEKLILKNYVGIIKNPYLPRNAKLVALSIPIRCYGILMKLREKLKG